MDIKDSIDFKLKCWYSLPNRPCPYEQLNGYGEQACRKICHMYLEMCHLISTCGMPNAEKWLKKLAPEACDVEAFKELQKIKDNIVEFVKNGKHLYIHSDNCGNGKTTWALKLMYKYFDSIWNGNGFRRRGYFLYTSEFLNTMKFPTLISNQEFKQLSNIVRNVDLLIWDDIAVTQLTKAEHNILLSVIDHRVQQGKTNIYTGNLIGEELLEALGARLYDRIAKTSKIITFKGVSRRDIS